MIEESFVREHSEDNPDKLMSHSKNSLLVRDAMRMDSFGKELRD
jgi:hypothetical protein